MILQHCIEKVKANDGWYAVSWIQLIIFGKKMQFWKKKIKIY